MLIKNIHTGKYSDITDIVVRHHGTISDLVNRNTCKFFMDNSDPHEFTVEYHTPISVMQRTRQFTKVDSLVGAIADTRYRLITEKGYVITKFMINLKPKSLIKLEKQMLTGMIPYQNPVKYTIIFDNKANP